MNFSPCVLCFWCYFLFGAVAQESKSTLILEASGSVKNGLIAYYDATTAKLSLQLQMLIHRLSDVKSQQEINYRVELALVNGSKETVSDYQFSLCSKTFSKFAGSCKERHLFMPLQQLIRENFTIQFEHVYSGCYKLNIKCCSNRKTFCSDCDFGEYEQYLGYLETSLRDVDINLMNMSISLKPNEGRAEVEFLVNYAENPPETIRFKEFDVTIENKERDLIWKKTIINSNVVNFINCTETNACQPSYHPDQCECFPIGTYTVSIDVADSRCNHRIQNCVTSKHPCKRYSTTPVLLNFTKNDVYLPFPFKLDITFIWVPLLVLLIVVILVTFVYLKRDWILTRQLNAALQCEVEESTHFPLLGTALNVRVLLFYDTNDESIRLKAKSLRQKLIACRGVSMVYDACDPDQQENVIIRGEIHWFNGYVNDPEVRIIVIQSIGMNQCHDELNRDPNATCSVQNEGLEKLTGLMFMLDQLFALAFSISQSDLYSRIFVATYDDVQCNKFRNPLTPYRCYVLPQHYKMLINQMLVDGCDETR